MAFLVVFCSAAQLLSLGIGFLYFFFFPFARVPPCLCTCARVPTHKGVDKDRGGKKEQGVVHISLPSHMVMYPSLSCLSFIWPHYCCFQRIWWVQNGWIFFFCHNAPSTQMLPYSSDYHISYYHIFIYQICIQESQKRKCRICATYWSQVVA